MSAKHALLGLLLHRSAYPYELADRLQQRLGPAWAVNSGQVSQAMKQLERDGMIERVGGETDCREDRHYAAITESGVQEFERWFEATTGRARLTRRPLLVKITLAGPERLRDALMQIDAYERDCAARLSELSHVHAAIPNDGLPVRADHVLLRLSLSADIFQLDGELKWARHAHETVSWLLAREARWPSETGRTGALAETAHERRDARRGLFDRMAIRHLRSAPGETSGHES